MPLLSRVAERIYWAGRYIERAEDAARVLAAFGSMLAEISTDAEARWSSIATVVDSDIDPTQSGHDDEATVVTLLLADREMPNSVLRTVEACRENLRTCREVLPREAWQIVNDLALYVRAQAPNSIGRRQREAFLARVVNDSRRLDGVLTSSMTRDEAFEMWEFGRYIERADMTTRVLGVRAATLLSLPSGGTDVFAEVRWMSVLRSLSALQMYQRSSHGPIFGPDVVRFLLFDDRFPRSVAGCLAAMRASLLRQPSSETVLHALEAADRELRSCRPRADDGAALDSALDGVQAALGQVHVAFAARYLAA